MGTLMKRHLPVSTFLLLLLNLHLGQGSCCYTYIFSMGDSIIDTGNYVRILGDRPNPYAELPYGMTYFKKPTGRICNGRVIPDFYAHGFNLPFVPPSLVGSAPDDFPHGANFAVFGATALPPSYYQSRFNMSIPTAYYLNLELSWFKDMLPKFQGGDSKKVLSESLILLGGIGANDYNYWSFSGRPRDQADSLIPDVVGAIVSAIQELICLGAKTIVVPGNMLRGCAPSYLSAFQSQDESEYDQYGCLRWYNDFSQRHNLALQAEIDRLKPLNPGVKLIYADYYGAASQLFQNPAKFGIPNPLVACCGGDGTYHTGSPCNANATIWGDPAKFVSWDGTHLTEAAYEVIATGVLHGPYADPPLLETRTTRKPCFTQ